MLHGYFGGNGGKCAVALYFLVQEGLLQVFPPTSDHKTELCAILLWQ